MLCLWQHVIMWRVTLQIAKAARGTSSCFDVHLVAFAPQLAARSKLHLPRPHPCIYIRSYSAWHCPCLWHCRCSSSSSSGSGRRCCSAAASAALWPRVLQQRTRLTCKQCTVHSARGSNEREKGGRGGGSKFMLSAAHTHTNTHTQVQRVCAYNYNVIS